MLSRFSQTALKAPIRGARNASSSPTTTTTVSVWERQKLYGRTPSGLVDPIHGSGRAGRDPHQGSLYSGMGIFIGAIGGTLFGGILLMETCRKAAE